MKDLLKPALVRRVLIVIGVLILIPVVGIGTLAITSGSADPPSAFFGGGPLLGGELVTGPEPDWSFVGDVGTVELQLLSTLRGRAWSGSPTMTARPMSCPATWVVPSASCGSAGRRRRSGMAGPWCESRESATSASSCASGRGRMSWRGSAPNCAASMDPLTGLPSSPAKCGSSNSLPETRERPEGPGETALLDPRDRDRRDLHRTLRTGARRVYRGDAAGSDGRVGELTTQPV